MFLDLPLLTELSLAYNRLSGALPLVNLPRAETIVLSANNLSALHPSTFGATPQV